MCQRLSYSGSNTVFPISKALPYEITTTGYTPNLEKCIPIPWQPPSLSFLVHRTPRCTVETLPTALSLSSHPELELHFASLPPILFDEACWERRGPGRRVLQDKEPVPKLPTLLLWGGHTKSITKGLGFDNRQHSMPWTKRVPITHQPTTRKSDCRASVLWEQKVQASLT